MYKKATKMEAKRLRATIFAIAKQEEGQQYEKQQRKEALNQCTKPLQKKGENMLRVTTFAITKVEKRKIYWKQQRKVHYYYRNIKKINSLIVPEK